MKNYISKLEDAVNTVKVIAGITPKDIIVTGSVALKLQGLLSDDRDVHDIDMIVKMDDKTWDMFENLDRISNEIGSNYNVGGNIMIKINDISINIWRNCGEYKTTITESKTGVKIMPAGEILSRKMNYGRVKDLDDILSIICSISNKKQ